jgi:hypothetical protein
MKSNTAPKKIMGRKLISIPKKLPIPPVPRTDTSTPPAPLLTPATSNCSTILEPDSFLEVYWLPSDPIAVRLSPLISIDSNLFSDASDITLLIGISEDPPNGSLKTVRKMAITPTAIKRYINMLLMERIFI